MQNKEKKMLVINNSTGCCVWRVNPQLKYLIKKGWEVRSIKGKGNHSWEDLVDLVEWADVVMLQCVFDHRLVDLIKEKKKKFIFEYDDVLDEVPETHPSYKTVNDPKFSEDVFYAMKKADLMITTNELLKARYKEHNKNIHIFPNYLDLEYWEKQYRPNTNKKQVRLGWCGGISHQLDLEFIAPVIGKILKKYPEVKFVHVGDGGAYMNNPLIKLNYGEDHFVNLPIRQREHSLGTPIEVWADKLNSLRLDLAVAPLVNNEFARHKTPIKWMEYAINKVPSVCAEFIYGQVIEDGVNGFTAKDEDEYFEKLCKLIEDESLRKKMGEVAYEDVTTRYNITDYLEEWAKIIDKLYG